MNNAPEKNGKPAPPDRITINTGSSKYSFTPDWVEDEGLSSILAGLVADDLNRQHGNSPFGNGRY